MKTDKDDLGTIRSFSFETAQNLRTFLRVGECFGDIKNELRDHFVAALIAYIKKQLESHPGWEIDDRMSEKWDRPFPALFIYYKAGSALDNYAVAIEPQKKPGQSIVYGVKNGRDTKESPASFSPQIFGALNVGNSTGKSSQWWGWYKYFRPPYDNWNSSDMLSKMWESNKLLNEMSEFDDTVKYVGDTLIDLVIKLSPLFEKNQVSQEHS